MKAETYRIITGKIVDLLQRGVRPWERPWGADRTEGRVTRPLRATGEPYRGINVLMLWGAALDAGFSSPFWMTLRQANLLGGRVRKGERSSPVVYADRFVKTEQDETGGDVKREIPFLKAYAVFNAAQVDGLPDRFNAAAAPPRLDPPQRSLLAEAFIAATGAEIVHAGSRAFYAMQPDLITVPRIEAFRDAEAYYGTLLHELIHWTRHPSRLGREFGRKRWGDEGYAMEELVAELGAAYLAADLGTAPETPEENAAYIASWIAVLKNNPHALFSAGAHAEKAAGHLHALQPEAGR